MTVYFVLIGKHVKIGFTRNLKSRIKTFLTSAADARLLLAVPGDRALERELHELLKEERIARELFRHGYRVLEFIEHFERKGLPAALEFLRRTMPEQRKAAMEAERQARVRIAQLTRAQEDAHYASLVAERKRQIGW